MPRLSGVNLLGVLLAAIVMFFVGFLFYGMLFSGHWMAARGYMADMAAGANPAWMAGGFLIELVLAVVVALPILAYDFVYGFYHYLPNLMVDWGHILVSIGLAGAVLSFFD
jgi:hypothetical protein